MQTKSVSNLRNKQDLFFASKFTRLDVKPNKEVFRDTLGCYDVLLYVNHLDLL